MNTPPPVARRRLTLALGASLCIALGLMASCTEPTGLAPASAESESAVFAPARTRALSGSIAVTAISIETRQWNGIDLPAAADLPTAFGNLSTTAPGYTNAPVALASLACNEYFPDPNFPFVGVCATSVSNPAGSHANVATRYRVDFSSQGSSAVAFRFGIDFMGGVMILDGQSIVATNYLNEFWWNSFYYEDELGIVGVSTGVLQAEVTVGDGPHFIEVIGFDDGVDGGVAAQFNVGAPGGWTDVVAPAQVRLLTVAKAGTGTGTVTSAPDNSINCGATCSASFTWGSTVTLTATPGSTSLFTGWSVAGCSGPTCVVTMDAAKTVTATFRQTYSGTVSIDAITIETRNWTIASGTPTAATAASLFAGLSTAAAGYTNEPVRVTGLSNNGALFTPPIVGAHRDIATRTVIGLNSMGTSEVSFRLDVDFAFGGALFVDGTLVSSIASSGPGNFSLFATDVVLTPGAHSLVVIGFEDGDDATARAEFNDGRGWTNVTAPALPGRLLTVSAGLGGGTVTSAPLGINCGTGGTACSDSLTLGQQAVLTAAPDLLYAFAGWGGACTGTDTCVLRMQADRAVTASFARRTFALVVTPPTGTGGGTVTCDGGTCAESLPAGTLVTLTAVPDGTSFFSGWSGACSGTTGPVCTVTMSDALSVTASFTRITHAMTVAQAGTGGGTISCAVGTLPVPCATSFDVGTVVTLTAAPDLTSVFGGWSVAGCSGPSCTVTISAALNVIATFTRITYQLTVSTTGAGTGTVTSSPAGVSCGANCASYDAGTIVVLTAAPDPTSAFVEWSGACSGSSTTCSVAMSAVRSVTATFRVTYTGTASVEAIMIETRFWDRTGEQPSAATATTLFNSLPIDRAGYSNEPVTVASLASLASLFTLPNVAAARDVATRGLITLQSAGTSEVTFRIDADFGAGGMLLVDGATIDARWSDIGPGGWSLTGTAVLTPGAHVVQILGFENCCGTGGVIAEFNDGSGWRGVAATLPAPVTLTVSTGTGGGQVSSAPAGIDCGSTCSASYGVGTQVILMAAPDPSFVFTGWTGACTGTGACAVRMQSAASVTANFAKITFPLAVTLAGTGSGAVVCGAAPCAPRHDIGTIVTLSASPDPTSVFTGWSGAGCSGTGDCVVTMNSAQAVTATFTRITYALDVTLATGSVGAGVVTSSPAGIDCGAACASVFNAGTIVTLTATPGTGYAFAGWGGACGGTAVTCQVTMDAARSVTAAFAVKTFALTVTRTGTGTIVSAPLGIDCGPTCAASFDSSTVVTLTATPGAGYTFAAWGGACSGSSDTCQVTMSAARNVTATFAVKRFALTVSRTGSGTVASTPAGIDCGVACVASFDSGTVVTLTATPGTGYTFAGWSGACSAATGNCVVTMAAAQSVTATFAVKKFALTVATTGTGTVTSAPAGINCGAACVASFDSNTVVTLTATPGTGFAFAGWSGACGGGAVTCQVTMSAARSVTAAFTKKVALTVTKDGTGTGKVTSAPAGINCGATCSASFDVGTVVKLTATPTAGSAFVGWSGGACAGTGNCLVTMTAATAVIATFRDVTPPRLSCAATPKRLWPPNHKMVDIRVAVSLTDIGSGAGGFTLLSVTSDEPDDATDGSWWDDRWDGRRDGDKNRRREEDRKGWWNDDDDEKGDGRTVNDIQGWSVGTADVTGQLRAERSGRGDGRTYTLTYRGVDLAGNSTTSSCTVTVPHDNR